MGTAFSVDLSNQQAEVEVLPENSYCPPVLSLRGSFGTLQIAAANEQLAEIEFALRTHLDGIRYPETPDQQAIMNHEIDQSIEEVIA
jgi:hypothetical protein